MDEERTVYGTFKPVLQQVLDDLTAAIETYNAQEKEKSGEAAYEHLIYRIKGEASMAEKCRRKGLPPTAVSALHEIRDAIGIRIVCRFMEDIYMNIGYLRALEGCTIVAEKDYIKNVKPNGYRSYHLILQLERPYPDALGRNPGLFYAEVQLRTIAMDSWASLEHEMKYKREIKNAALICRELKRCADELAACDVSMQTIRRLIRDEGKAEG